MLAPVWAQALHALVEAGQIFVIGYSMPETDAFFKYMLASALAKNRAIDRVVVVNPDPDVIEHYAQLFQRPFRDRRFSPIRHTAASYVWYDLGNHLGQFEVGLDRHAVEASGFKISP